jgi:hypothetical protein
MAQPWMFMMMMMMMTVCCYVGKVAEDNVWSLA